MEGEHLLDNKGLVQVAINNIENLTLKGEGAHSNAETIIKCSSNTRGLVFNNSNVITIYDITITGCGQQDISPLLFINITSLHIYHITLYNNTCNSYLGGTLHIICITDTHITITNSAFTNNNIIGDGGGLLIHSYTDIYTLNFNSITITNSTFINNTVGGNGGGLFIHSYIDTYNSITITNSIFTNNTVGGNGGGQFIYSYTDIYNSITIYNSVFTNNIVDGDGGGLFIYSNTYINNNVTIYSSAFTNNTNGGSGGGLLMGSYSDIENNVNISNSIFNNNIIVVGGGGLHIYSITHNIHNNVTITNSAFNSNTAHDGGGLFIHHVSDTDIHNNLTITNSAFIDNTVGRDGGGLLIYSDTYMHVHNHINIINSAFINNMVGHYGGGLFIYSDNHICNSINVTNSAFTNNIVSGDGGGLYIYSYTDIHNDITITNSAFTNNTVGVNNKDGGNGGGLLLESINGIHNNITITNSTFTYNSVVDGGGLCIYSYKDTDYNNVTIVSSKFTNNKGSGLFFNSAKHYEIKLSKVNIFNNNHSGIIAFNHVTVVFTEGHSIVANNSSPTDGGGIYLGKDSFLTTSNGGHTSFINNTAYRYGGAIYSLDNDYYLFSTLKLYAYSFDQCTVYNLSANFTNNSAVVAGDQLYGGIFVLCQDTWVYNNYYLKQLLDCTNVPDTIKHQVSSVHPLSPVSSHPLVVCPCVNNAVDCTVKSLDRQVYPGQILNVSLITTGLCGGVSPGTVAVDHDKDIRLISSATTTDYTSTSCTTLFYTVKVTTNISVTTILLEVANSDILSKEPISVHLSILPCPLGLILDSASGECVCSNDISHISGVICNISWMPYPIQRSGDNWISYRYQNHNCTMVHTGCPFDYCNISSVKFNFNETDLQCSYNRSGILCGQCTQGLSLVLGSNRCADCTDTSMYVTVSLVILIAVAGIALVALVKLANLTISVGSINGLLFYGYIIKVNESVFFPDGDVPVVSQFIAWINLDLGFEYCFISQLDGYLKTWLQFVFPLYLWLLVVAIVVACRYSGRVSRLWTKGDNSISALATLILMPYSKMLRNITNVFSFNPVYCGVIKLNVWIVDANVEYLSTKHAFLFIVSFVFFLIGLIYTVLLLSVQWLQRYSGKCCKGTRDPIVRLKPLLDVYTGPYRDKHRFWTGLRPRYSPVSHSTLCTD